MKVTAYSGHIVSGTVKFDDDVKLPENTKVLIVPLAEAPDIVDVDVDVDVPVERAPVDIVLPKLEPGRVIHIRTPYRVVRVDPPPLDDGKTQ